jgi:hypothetical protein
VVETGPDRADALRSASLLNPLSPEIAEMREAGHTHP